MSFWHVYQRQIEWAAIVVFCLAFWASIGAGLYLIVAAAS